MFFDIVWLVTKTLFGVLTVYVVFEVASYPGRRRKRIRIDHEHQS